MKSYLILAFTISVAQAVSHGFSGTPFFNNRRSGLVEQRYPLYANQRYGISGRPAFTETFHEESGNLYRGQRGGQLFRNPGDNTRGLQYSLGSEGDYSGSRGQFGNLYSRQSRFDQNRGDNLRYGSGHISFQAPLANTRSYNPQYDVAGNQLLRYY